MVYQSATTPTHTSNGAHTPVNGSSRSSQTGSGTGAGTGIGTGSGSALSHGHSKKLIIRRRSSRSSTAPVKSSVSSRSAISEYYPESVPEPMPSQSLSSKKLIQIMPEEAGGTAWQVEDEPFYHGFMSNNECKPLLTNPGDFLVRRAEIDGEMQYVITVLPENSNEITNFIIKKTRPKHLYYVYIYAFKTISDLIAYHSRMKKPLNNENVCIVKGIARSDWQLAHEQIERNKKLGEGAFGEVWEGTLNLGVFRGYIPVAIKTLHSGNISADERIKFLREANLMLKLSHPNIIKFYGVATLKDPIMIVMEFASGGSLLTRVQNTKRPPTDADKIRYCAGAASGLAYLETMQIIHRDIAARNCLLSADDEVKLSDFGLSLLGIKYRERSMKNVPIRWLSPETLKHGRFSSKTDVWSFGITIWEIYSSGQEPYAEIQDNKELRRGVIEQRVKICSPHGMPPMMQQIMFSCLTYDPKNRPTFQELNAKLSAARPSSSYFTLSSKIKGLFHF
uniref:Tyrosine-protein kinase n=1 Tax=Wuchereria bancrofti TaxID=6293 RepID=A0AAF5PNR0_WUCBA